MGIEQAILFIGVEPNTVMGYAVSLVIVLAVLIFLLLIIAASTILIENLYLKLDERDSAKERKAKQEAILGEYED